jgi:hypothetical protein
MSIASRRFGALVVALACTPVVWSAGGTSSEAQQRYKQERAHCLSGMSHQDKATCLKEAGAALQAARRNRLETGSHASFQVNATARCNAQPADDRDTCVQRITGSGSTQGSVEGGGLLRQVETPVK